MKGSRSQNFPQFAMLEGRVIHGSSRTSYPDPFLNLLLATQYWTEANIADGLTALATCIEASPLTLILLRY